MAQPFKMVIKTRQIFKAVRSQENSSKMRIAKKVNLPIYTSNFQRFPISTKFSMMGKLRMPNKIVNLKLSKWPKFSTWPPKARQIFNVRAQQNSIYRSNWGWRINGILEIFKMAAENASIKTNIVRSQQNLVSRGS